MIAVDNLGPWLDGILRQPVPVPGTQLRKNESGTVRLVDVQARLRRAEGLVARNHHVGIGPTGGVDPTAVAPPSKMKLSDLRDLD